MARSKNYKSEEKRLNEKAHWFGQEGGNKPYPQKMATAQREFYRWVIQGATQKELESYVKNEGNPFFRRQFILRFKLSESVNDFLQVTNQVYGLPKQTVEVQELPPINCEVFGDEE